MKLAGGLVLVDRKGDLVITGGVNVYPVEVERALVARLHGSREPWFAVRAASRMGRRAFCALVAGSVTADDEAELREFLRARLASYQIPQAPRDRRRRRLAARRERQAPAPRGAGALFDLDYFARMTPHATRLPELPAGWL